MAVDLQRVYQQLRGDDVITERRDEPTIDLTDPERIMIQVKHPDLPLHLLKRGVAEGDVIWFQFGSSPFQVDGIPLRCADRLLEFHIIMPQGTAVLSNENHPQNCDHERSNQMLFGDPFDCDFQDPFEERIGRCTCPRGLKGLGAFCDCGQ